MTKEVSIGKGGEKAYCAVDVPHISKKEIAAALAKRHAALSRLLRAPHASSVAVLTSHRAHSSLARWQTPNPHACAPTTAMCSSSSADAPDTPMAPTTVPVFVLQIHSDRTVQQRFAQKPAFKIPGVTLTKKAKARTVGVRT